LAEETLTFPMLELLAIMNDIAGYDFAAGFLGSKSTALAKAVRGLATFAG